MIARSFRALVREVSVKMLTDVRVVVRAVVWGGGVDKVGGGAAGCVCDDSMHEPAPY
jgi:hypothetical protein